MTVLELIARLGAFDEHHRNTACPGCDADLTHVGLPKLLYRFEVCQCGTPAYDHLVEQLWHADCYRHGGDTGPLVTEARRLVELVKPGSTYLPRAARTALVGIAVAIARLTPQETTP